MSPIEINTSQPEEITEEVRGEGRMTQPVSERYVSMPMQPELIKKDLLRSATEGNWDLVKKIYKEEDSSIHKARITISGDTALHIALLEGEAQVAEQMVQLIRETWPGKATEVLEIENESGNTPLHLAASRGYVKMCECIAGIDPRLVGKRNRDSETPFFLAALHGKKDAFLCLHSRIKNLISDDGKEAGYIYSRRRDGDTILHCAISGEYFDLASEIIDKYENLVHSFNEQGFSPLHLLANKPSAFPSANPDISSLFEMISYHCLVYSRIFECLNERKEKQVWSLQIMNKIIQRASKYDYVHNGGIPQHALNECEKKPYAVEDGGIVEFSEHMFQPEDEPKIQRNGEKDPKPGMSKGEKTPILAAAKHGVVEIIEKILEFFPVAIHDMNCNKKNVVLLAVENRQPHVFMHLLKEKLVRDSIFRKVDKDGNSALHLAATLAKSSCPYAGAALQMHWDIKWFEPYPSLCPNLRFFQVLAFVQLSLSLSV